MTEYVKSYYWTIYNQLKSSFYLVTSSLHWIKRKTKYCTIGRSQNPSNSYNPSRTIPFEGPPSGDGPNVTPSTPEHSCPLTLHLITFKHPLRWSQTSRRANHSNCRGSRYRKVTPRACEQALTQCLPPRSAPAGHQPLGTGALSPIHVLSVAIWTAQSVYFGIMKLICT